MEPPHQIGVQPHELGLCLGVSSTWTAGILEISCSLQGKKKDYLLVVALPMMVGIEPSAS